MKRLIAHIGPRKTGSTSIQNLLASLREPLGAAGIHVPRACTTPSKPGKHTGLAVDLDSGRTGHWARLAEEIRATDAERVVISHEDFPGPWLRPKAPATRLGEFAAREGLEVDIIAYVRPQWQVLEAEYSQDVRSKGIALPFNRFVAQKLAARDNTILDYNVVFAPFRATFGARLRIFPLEPPALPDGLLAHFLALIGAPPGLAANARPRRANVRRGAKEIEVRRLLRERLPRWRQWREEWLPDLVAVIGDDAPFAGFSRPKIRALEDRFADANRRFALDYGIDRDGTLFRDAGHGDARRPNVADWASFDERQRQRVRHHVRRELGFDLNGGFLNRALQAARYGSLDMPIYAARRLRARWRRAFRRR